MPRMENELAPRKFQGVFKRHHRIHPWGEGLNHVLCDIKLDMKAVFVASVDCAKAFDTVSFPALQELLSDSPYHTLVQKLLPDQRLRVYGTNKWLFSARETPREVCGGRCSSTTR